MKLHMMEVGKLFIPGKTRYQEASVLEYTETGPMLIIAVNRPTEKEVQAARIGRIELAFYETEQVLWFLFKIYDQTGQSPYWHWRWW